MSKQASTRQLQALDQAHHLHPFTDLHDYSQQGGRIVSRAEHIYIYDSDGNKMLDGMSGLWCCNLGYSQQAIKDAITAQLDDLPFYNNFFKCSNQPAVELARAVEQEVELLKRLRHPNVVAYVDAIRTGRHLHILLEYMEKGGGEGGGGGGLGE